MEDLKIRKIIFDVEGKNKYNYDVHQGIKIADIKRMLDTALQMSRFKMIIFNDGKDYTNLNDSKIENLFPNKKEILFQVNFQQNKIQQSNKEIDVFFPKRKTCQKHENKFLSHFCFECNISFCSVCHKNGEHSDHESIEKYDYLLDSEIIVERIFKKTTNDISNISSDKNKVILEMEKKIQEIFSDLIKNLIKKLEDRAKYLLKFYEEVYDNSYNKLNCNLKRVKEICVEVLTEKKEELGMQKLISDDQVVISYYNTILQIYNQRNPFNSEILKLLNLEKSYTDVYSFIEKTNIHLSNFLNSTIKNDEEFFNCHDLIKNKEIIELTREKIKKNLETEIYEHRSNAPLDIDDYYTNSPDDKNIVKSDFKSIGKKHHLDDITNMAYIFNLNAPVTRIDFTSEKKFLDDKNKDIGNEDKEISHKKLQENINRIGIGKSQSNVRAINFINHDNLNIRNEEIFLRENIQSAPTEENLNGRISRNIVSSLINNNLIEVKKYEKEEENINYIMEIEKEQKPNIPEKKNESSVSNNNDLFKNSFNNQSYNLLPKKEIINNINSSAAELAKKDPMALFSNKNININNTQTKPEVITSISSNTNSNDNENVKNYNYKINYTGK